jgi:hypothetical protein
MFKHKKVSAKADTADATLVQPTDWNDDHVIGRVGSVIVVGTATFVVNGTTLSYPAQFPVGGGYIGYASRVAQGEYTVPVDIPTMAADLLPSGYTFQLKAILTVRPKGTLTSGYQWDAGQNGDSIQIVLGDTSWNPVNPNVECHVDVLILAAVVPV